MGIDSDEEQADTLSPDQIRRFIDESRTRRDAADDSSHPAELSERIDRGRGSSNDSHHNRTSRSNSRTRRRVCAAPLVDEGDELFDEEFEDDAENVVVGAKLKPLSSSSDCGAAAQTQQSDRGAVRNSHDSWMAAVDEEFVPPSLTGVISQELSSLDTGAHGAWLTQRRAPFSQSVEHNECAS